MSHDYISSPVTAIGGDITVPGDKSMSHRAIMLAAIAQGTTTITGFLSGQDCLATISAFQAMGVIIKGPIQNCVTVVGVGKTGLKKPLCAINCGNSGTSMRLLAGLLSAQPFDTIVLGDASLNQRPMARITLPLSNMGAQLSAIKNKPPLLIQGNVQLKGICYTMPKASAQVKSCLLLAGLYAQGKTTIIEPILTRDHTEKLLQSFAYPIDIVDNSISVCASYVCQATEIKIPGDLSSAAFFIVAATLIPRSKLHLRQVGVNPTRTGVIDILTMMGARITLSNHQLYGAEPVADIYVESVSGLQGITIPKTLVPLAIDEFPILFIAAAKAQGQTRFQGLQELRFKECDRIHAMTKGLSELGIDIAVENNDVVINGGDFSAGIVDSYHDHRIAMAFAIAGSIAKAPIRIKHCNHVATSFPNFIAIARKVKLAIKEMTYDKDN